MCLLAQVFMLLPESLLVILACTLSGGVERPRDGAGGTCGRGTGWSECGVLDEGIKPVHLAVPWGVTLGGILILGMPTLLLRSKHKEQGLSLVAWNLFQCLGLMICSSFVTDHPSICFALSLHSCVLLLGHLEVSKALVGPGWWWGLRYACMLALLVWEIALGPALSVVRWPSTPEGTALPCAYLAHLAGAVVPDCVMFCLRAMLFAGRCMWDDGRSSI